MVALRMTSCLVVDVVFDGAVDLSATFVDDVLGGHS